MAEFPVPPSEANALFESMADACDEMMIAIEQARQANQALADALSSPRLQFPVTKQNYSTQAEYIKQREALIKQAEALIDERGREYNDAYSRVVKHLEALGIREMISLSGERMIEIEVGKYLIKAGLSEDRVVFKMTRTTEE